MDLALHAGVAVALVNTLSHSGTSGVAVDALRVPSDLASLLPPDMTLPAGGLTAHHLAAAQDARRRLRGVLDSIVDGDVDEGLRDLNRLLADVTVVGHLSRARGRLRLEVHSPQGDPAADLVAAAVVGLAARLSVDGVERVGRCMASPCRNIYLDTSTNRSRRYCSERCATRANVAAYRARRRAAAPAPAVVSSPTVPASRESVEETETPLTSLEPATPTSEAAV